MSPFTKNISENRILRILAGIFLSAIAIFLLIPWDGVDMFIGVFPWLDLLIVIGYLVVGLWLIIDGLRSPSSLPRSKPSILVDEWIGEQGLEEEEISDCQKHLEADEKLLAIIAARGEPGVNRLALTNRRIIIYPQGEFRSGVPYNLEEIYNVQGKRERPLTYLGELIFSTVGGTVTFQKAGMEGVDEVIKMISNLKQRTI